MEQERQIRKTGWFCLGGGVLLAVCAWGLGILLQAAKVGGGAFALGAAFGLGLAAITRTRRPLFIYLALGATGAALWLAVQGFPLLEEMESDRNRTALEWLRLAAFLLGAPYPFARYGFHAADSVPENTSPKN